MWRKRPVFWLGITLFAMLVGCLGYSEGVSRSIQNTDCDALAASLHGTDPRNEEFVTQVRSIARASEGLPVYPLMLQEPEFEALFDTASEVQDLARAFLVHVDHRTVWENAVVVYAMRGLPDEDFLEFAEDMVRFHQCGWINDHALVNVIHPFLEPSPIVRNSLRPRVRALLRHVRSEATSEDLDEWSTLVLRQMVVGSPLPVGPLYYALWPWGT